MNIKEATKQWVREFNCIPQELILKAYPNFEGIEILATNKECGYCGYTEFEKNEEGEMICSGCGRLAEECAVDQIDLPMWGYMWTFENSIDEEWARNNLETMLQCGFWVYESDEIGLFFGVNGAGYDFYEKHWIPLYKARGLQWHDRDEE